MEEKSCKTSGRGATPKSGTYRLSAGTVCYVSGNCIDYPKNFKENPKLNNKLIDKALHALFSDASSVPTNADGMLAIPGSNLLVKVTPETRLYAPIINMPGGYIPLKGSTIGYYLMFTSYNSAVGYKPKLGKDETPNVRFFLNKEFSENNTFSHPIICFTLKEKVSIEYVKNEAYIHIKNIQRLLDVADASIIIEGHEVKRQHEPTILEQVRGFIGLDG